MLELKQIKKDYTTAGDTVHALKGIDLRLRDHEFVSILGPSGCGKTTMLNIIGGLDGYDSGDLYINGRSTKDFNDRDWDTYRNHSVGFVFQSYNLIPHQTVLANVELAMTLSGVSKGERRKRAKEALIRVGLGDKLKKHPNEMSGGQMQRVAIARAIVNNPDIVLADEPTGALDTETGIQVMEILKEISKDRLVVMVTHNPDLAERYSTRTVNMLDGVMTADSMPLTDEENAAFEAKKAEIAALKKPVREKKPSMSFFTSFGLSLNNLFTKKGRTTLTSFAGSIGIIGIALIYAVSQGATNYINTVQEETLTAYPLSLESETIELSSLIETFMGKAEAAESHENDAVYQKAMVASLVNTLNSIEASSNDLAAFKAYLEERLADENDESGLRKTVSGVQYSYNLNLLIYTENVDGNIIHSDVSDLMSSLILANMSSMTGMDMSLLTDSSSSMMSSSLTSSYSTLFQEMLPGTDGSLINDVFYNQYDLVYGSWPNEYNEIVLVVDENNEVADLSLYALGLISEETMNDVFTAMSTGKTLDESKKNWSYEEICSGDYRVILPCDCYTYDAATGEYTDLRDTDTGLRMLYSNAVKLKVSGIIRVKEDTVTTIMSGAIGYTSELTEYIINESNASDIAAAQKENSDTDIFTGKIFKTALESMSDEKKAELFRNEAKTLTDSEKAEKFIQIKSVPSSEEIAAYTNGIIGTMTRADLESLVISSAVSQMGVDEATARAYISAMSDDELKSTVASAIEEQYKAAYAETVQTQLASLSEAQLAAMYDAIVESYTDEQCAEIYETTAEVSHSTCDYNLILLGCLDIATPSTINIYASSFEDKDTIEEAIAAYNESADDAHQIKYTDYVGIMMSSVTTIINAITYVLIAFVAISLVVSSIMIGVITLISVQERTKEIGILRAIGASKANVSSMFNAETVIIGFASGIIGVGVTYLLCIPINLILHSLTGIGNLSAHLPVSTAVALVIISVLLTLIAGIIPSRSAAKKDPVIALRTE